MTKNARVAINGSRVAAIDRITLISHRETKQAKFKRSDLSRRTLEFANKSGRKQKN